MHCRDLGVGSFERLPPHTAAQAVVRGGGASSSVRLFNKHPYRKHTCFTWDFEIAGLLRVYRIMRESGRICSSSHLRSFRYFSHTHTKLYTSRPQSNCMTRSTTSIFIYLTTYCSRVWITVDYCYLTYSSFLFFITCISSQTLIGNTQVSFLLRLSIFMHLNISLLGTAEAQVLA